MTVQKLEVNRTPHYPRPSMALIQKLNSDDLPLYEAHLKRLSEEDRLIRFGYSATDNQIHRYIATQFRTRSSVLAVLDDNQEVVAAMEVVFSDSKYIDSNTLAEIGLTVEPQARGQGLGTELFRRALVTTRARGALKLVSHSLTRNPFMLRAAQRSGMSVHHEQPLVATEQSSIHELVGAGMSLWDYEMIRKPSMFNYANFVQGL